jgi:hypothetical protein
MPNGTPQILFATGTTGTAHCRGWGGTAHTSGTIQSEKAKSKGEPQWRKKLLTSSEHPKRALPRLRKTRWQKLQKRFEE